MSHENYTEAELEEARYMIWVAKGGPQKREAKHRALAVDATADLIAAGWTILQDQMVRESYSDSRVMELVIRKGDSIELIRWHPFNKGWMHKLDCGWGIFES